MRADQSSSGHLPPAAGVVVSIAIIALVLAGAAGNPSFFPRVWEHTQSNRPAEGQGPVLGGVVTKGGSGAADSASSIGVICLTTGMLLAPGQNCPYQYANPTQIAWDPADGELYAASQGGAVFVISPSNDTVVARAAGELFANGVAVDSRNGDVYVAGWGGVAVIRGTTSVGVINLSSPSAGGITFDPANGDLYVPEYRAGHVDVIDGATNTLVGNITVGGSLWGAVYDSWNQDLYIVGSSGGVAVVNGTTNLLVTRISGVGGAQGGAFDPVTGEVYIPDQSQDTLDVINGSTNTVVAEVGIHTSNTTQYDPVLAGYDPDTGDICVPDFFENDVAVVAGPSNTVLLGIPTGTESWGVAFVPSDGDVYVTNFGNDTISIISPPDTIPKTFSEKGLAAGTNWTITTSSFVESEWNLYWLQETSLTPRITLYEPNGSTDYSVRSAGYVASPSTGEVNVIGIPTTVAINFSTSSGVSNPGAFPVSVWYLVGILIGLIATVAAAVWVVRRRARSDR